MHEMRLRVETAQAKPQKVPPLPAMVTGVGKVKIMYRSGCIAFEPSPSGFKAYIFNEDEYLETPVTGEDGFDVLGALIEAITPTVGEIEKELTERVEYLKRDIEFYKGHRWNVEEKEKELKTCEAKLTTLKNIKESLKNTRSLVEAYSKLVTKDC